MLSGRRKLLLADDSPTIQKVIALTFEEMEVVAVSDGEQAVRALEAGSPPDIILADVWMPGPNGYELCERVKRDERLRHVPVVLLVGTFEPFNEAEARRVGADTFLTKPFQSIRDLVSKVGSLLGGEQKPERSEDAPPPRDEQAEAPPPRGADAQFGLRDAQAREGRAAEARRDESADDDAAPELADLGADDELIEAKPADSFGVAPARHDAAPLEDFREPPPAHSGAESSREPQPFAQPHHEPFAHEPRAENRDEQTMQDFQHEPSFAPAQGEPSSEAAAPARPSFATRAAGAAAADDALLDLGQLEPPAATSEADDFILDLEEDLPAPPRRAAAGGGDVFGASAFGEHGDAQPARAVALSDAPSAFAEAAHGEPASSFAMPSTSFDAPAAPSESFEFSSHARDDAQASPEVVMQDEPQHAAAHETGHAPRGFVEPSVVPADEPVPAAVEGRFTDGSVEGDVARAPAHGYHTRPVEEATQPAPFVPPQEPSAAGYSVGESRAGVEEPLRADQLSPEAIDKIARRVVELMSDRVVREIAWEVVPELAELIVRQRLDGETQK